MPNARKVVPWKADDVPVCNCANCARELVGNIPDGQVANYLKMVGNASVPHRRRVAGRLDGRPYCGECLRIRAPRHEGASVESDCQ